MRKKSRKPIINERLKRIAKLPEIDRLAVREMRKRRIKEAGLRIGESVLIEALLKIILFFFP